MTGQATLNNVIIHSILNGLSWHEASESPFDPGLNLSNLLSSFGHATAAVLACKESYASHILAAGGQTQADLDGVTVISFLAA